MTLSTAMFRNLWDNHPFNSKPCDATLFANQCAIRMGVAMEKSGLDTSSFDTMFEKRRCYPGLKHSPAHILAAHELAQWMNTKTSKFGVREKLISKSDRKNIIKGTNGPRDKGKKGIIFINNGWGPTDHIDLWDGGKMRAGVKSWLFKGDELWFWEARA